MKTATRKVRTSWRDWIAQKLGLAVAPLGNRGEAHAARFLKSKGMKILARNRTLGKGEIDLIAIDGQFLVFVEVRTCASDEFMTPEQSIRYRKRKKLTSTIRKLLRRHGRAGLRPRLDIVAVIWPNNAKKPTRVRHHPAAIPIEQW